MKFSLGCSLVYHVPAPMPFVFNVEVASFAGQTIRHDRLSLDPDLPVERWTMPETGNRYLRVMAQPGDLRLRYEADVTLEPLLEDPEAVTEVPAAKLPFQVMSHLYPSRYCQSDKLLRFAKSTFGDLAAGYRRVNGICNWIRDNVEYQKGVSDALTSAFDTVTERAGVCRDFAHLAIALCRAMGIPARYISAYAWRLAPPDFHAVIEAYLQGPAGVGWYLFDPTRMSAPDGLVRIGIGRDAADVAFSSPYGDVGFEKPEVWISGDNKDTEVTTQAVRLQRGVGKRYGSPVLAGGRLLRRDGRHKQVSQRRHALLGPAGFITPALKLGRRTEMTDENQRKTPRIDDLAAKYQVSPGAVETLIRAIRSGGGSQAQFNHPDLGGMGHMGRRRHDHDR
jgi:transglutaminase-like putative cysteine protease